MDYLSVCVFFLMFFIAGIFCCFQDWIKAIPARYAKTLFANLPNQQWWDFSKSNGNKWKKRDEAQGEAFFGSTTFLVFVTDAWHCFKALMLLFFILAAAMAISFQPEIINLLVSFNIKINNWVLMALLTQIGFLLYGLGFQLTEKVIVKK